MSHTHAAAATAAIDPAASFAGSPSVPAAQVAAVYQLRLACGQFNGLVSGPRERALPLLHETAMALHAFATAVVACEQAGLTRAQLEPELQDVRELHGQSPLVHRLQAWPRGYAGDFETVEWLCDARNHATVGTVPWAIEQCALQS